MAVIGDVHGNAVAFAAVLEEIRADPPDLVVVNGDLSWGAEPEATLGLADELEQALFVRGNAESALLRRSPDSETDAWMLERHSARTPRADRVVRRRRRGQGRGARQRLRLSRLAARRSGARDAGDARRCECGALLAGAELDVLVTAHVHLQFERTVLGITSMNAGSVGLQYGGTPAAYWAEIGPEIRLRRTPYDLDEAERRTRSSGIPTADRIVQTLREPPSAEEVIEHAERLVASD